MFSVIANIYNKKTKGPTLMELFTGTGKLKNFFSTTRVVRCVQHGWHGTHRYDIQVLTRVWQEIKRTHIRNPHILHLTVQCTVYS